MNSSPIFKRPSNVDFHGFLDGKEGYLFKSTALCALQLD
jgi:hypothetical protein